MVGFWGAVFALIWTIYYYAKRCTGGLVDTTDTIVCGIVGLICVVVIVRGVVRIYREKRKQE